MSPQSPNVFPFPHKNRVKLSFLFALHQLTMLSICTKFHEIICNAFKVIERTSFITKNMKSHNFVANVAGIKVLILSIFLIMLYI